MYRFQLHRPRTVAEACALLDHHGETARAYAGGTELLILMKLGLVRLEHLVDLKPLAALRGIERDAASGWLRLGAGVTHRAVERSAVVRAWQPALAALAGDVANVRVRNVGTLGGNLCFADPHSDPATLLLALDAELQLQAGSETRRVRLDGFFLGAYETVRGDGELLIDVRIPPLSPRTGVAYQKIRHHERPTASVAVRVQLAPDSERVETVGVAVGCVCPVPLLLPLDAARHGQLSATALPAALDELVGAAVADLDVVDDLNGSAAYKRRLVRVLARRAAADAVAQARADSGPGADAHD